MYRTTCPQCGSSDFVVSKSRPGDFPPALHFVECSRCGSTVGLTSLASLIDLSRRNSRSARAMARALLHDFPKGSPSLRASRKPSSV
ncbi:MAG TPA: hypothetical protein VI215_04490 [Bacteroidota bacterium]